MGKMAKKPAVMVMPTTPSGGGGGQHQSAWMDDEYVGPYGI